MNIIDSFCFPEEKKLILQEFKKIAKREGKSKSELNMVLIDQHVKSHSDGNPAFRLDQFQDPNFKAMPATMSPTPKWNQYVNKQMDRKERLELDKQLDYIRMLIKSKNHRDDMEKYGKIPDRS